VAARLRLSRRWTAGVGPASGDAGRLLFIQTAVQAVTRRIDDKACIVVGRTLRTVTATAQVQMVGGAACTTADGRKSVGTAVTTLLARVDGPLW
jgi:hypothetical protein